MCDPRLNLLALSYRIVYGILGGHITARFAPHSPMLHVWLFASIGFVLSAAGAIAAIGARLSSMWFPVALARTTFPCAWLGGALHRARGQLETEAGALQMTIAGDREVVLTCAFQAPSKLVFDALTKPEVIKLSYTPAGEPLTVCDVNLTQGGASLTPSGGTTGALANPLRRRS